jgi:hypothetical protein
LLLAMWGCAHPDSLKHIHPNAAEGSISTQQGAIKPEEWAARPLLAAVADDQNAVPAQQREVVYNAGFRLVVQSIDDAIKAMQQLAAETGGYLQEIKGDSVTIRVPAAKYDSAVERVAALGQVIDRQLQALDVTEEYVDLEARLNNARNVRKRLEALLEKAQTVEATLAVEKELNRVGEEIERLEAKLELLRHRVAYSTITAQFERVARQTELIRGFRELPFYWLRELDPNRLWLPF